MGDLSAEVLGGAKNIFLHQIISLQSLCLCFADISWGGEIRE